MTETGSPRGHLVPFGELTGISGVGSAEFFEIQTADEEDANRYYRNPYDYLEQLLEQEGRPANEVHIVHMHTPYVEEVAPSLRSLVLAMPNGVWISEIGK